MAYKSIITTNPEKRFGRPCARDTRIAVSDVLGWLAIGITNSEIITDFPELTVEDIIACQKFAANP